VNRLIISLLFFAVLSVGVGIMLSGADEDIDWAITGGLFALAVAGEGVRFWLKRSRAKKHQSSGI
jgi:cytochrome c-type biogenesis protein CcmE